MGDRAVTMYGRIYPIKQINGPQAQREFLVGLAQVIPANVSPTLVTDAGFRKPINRAKTGVLQHLFMAI